MTQNLSAGGALIENLRVAGILHICTANVIRSPMAELLTRALLPDCPVDSAGLAARPGQPIWPAAVEALDRRGIHADGFTASRLAPGAAREADLILTATRRHRDAVLTAQPRLLGRVFTWRELAWLTTGLTAADLPGRDLVGRLRAVREVVATRRGLMAAPPGDAFDVRDPIGGPPSAVDEALDAIEAALAAIVPVIAPPPLQ